jgi:hypothetical protein
MIYLAEPDSDTALTPLQAASCTSRIALAPQVGRKVLRLQSLPNARKKSWLARVTPFQRLQISWIHQAYSRGFVDR